MKRLPPHVWFVDFEFSGTDQGERPTPICCVAREWHSGQTFRLWEDELATCPYGTGEDSVLIAYAAAAELGCHLALNWPIPANVLCLHAEYRCHVNIAHGKGETPRGGLLDALDRFGIPHSTDKLEKKRLQERCARGAPWEPGEREEILAYCETDVTPLPALLEALLPHINVPQALERGRFVTHVAHMERTGIPIDVPKYKEVISKRHLVIAKLITPVDGAFKVYTGTTFKQGRFAAYLEREGIGDWPKTPSGRLTMKAKALENTLARYPQVKPLFDLQAQLGKLRKCSLKIGADGFARTGLLPFVAVTGRSQPGAKGFIFGQPAWLRFLIAAPSGYGIASLDWSGQEVMIAAAKSGDENLMIVARSADPHLTTGKMFGIIPEHGTEETHATEREMVKPFMFGTNYGAGVPLLAKLAKVSEAEANKLRILHFRTFPKFWRWIGAVKAEAYNKGVIETPSGWRMQVPPETRPTTLMDWPMQAYGGDMMRLAVCEAIEAGLTLCCTVHDALILLAPSDEIDAKVEQLKGIMNAASVATIGAECGIKSETFKHPEKFFSKKGAKMQATVEACLAELEGIEPPPPKPKRKARAMQLGDNETLHPYVAKIIENAEARIKTDEDPARTLFIGANEAVRRANGHCIPDIDAVLSRMQQAAIGEGVSQAEAEKIIRSAKRNQEIAGVPTTIENRAKALSAATKLSGKNVAAIKKGLIYG